MYHLFEKTLNTMLQAAVFKKFYAQHLLSLLFACPIVKIS